MTGDHISSYVMGQCGGDRDAPAVAFTMVVHLSKDSPNECKHG